MKVFKIFIALIITGSIVFYQACDVIEDPYLVPTDTIPINGGDTSGDFRKVLLEDYTGHRCPNCPGAAEEAHKLKLLYGDSLIVMAVHAGFFADPLPAGPFTYDFRTTEGSAFNNQFGIQTYPSGLVNRAEYSGSIVLNDTQWEGAVEQAVRKPQQAQIEIETDYNNGNRELSLTINSTFKEALGGTYYLSAFIVEDGIAAPQQDLHEILYDYVHNHVLRAAVNGTEGDALGNNGNIEKDVEYHNNFQINIDQEWVEDNCSVIAFIYWHETDEIIQAEEVKVK